jgi:hypothetical protein
MIEATRVVDSWPEWQKGSPVNSRADTSCGITVEFVSEDDFLGGPAHETGSVQCGDPRVEPA